VAPGVSVASVRSTVTTTSVGGVAGADQSRLTPGELPFYTTASGTSFTAPQVAGAIALMLEANPQLQPADIKNILSRTATPLPKYFYHEVGSGMLNTYAAVLEAAFPNRPIGMFRSTLTANLVHFTTSTHQTFTESVTPGQTRSVNVPLPANTLLASFGINWGFSGNDFGLKVYNASNTLVGESNYLNLPLLTGLHEEVVLRWPASQTFRADIRHTLGVGTTQNVHGAVEITQVEYPDLPDLNGLPADVRAEVEKSLLNNVMLPRGRTFGTNMPVTRSDLAAMIVRAGLVPQYMASHALFTDVTDDTTRNSVESVQSNPNGALFYDATTGGRFYPNNFATKLVAAVVFVKAAGLDSVAATATLPVGVTDAASIPAQWRGYVAVALQRGYLTLDGTQFNPNRAVNRIDLARAVNALMQ
jgi:serine protease AprX